MFISVIAFAKAYSQKATLSGTITEKSTGETLLNVNVVFPEIPTGTITNEYGFYSITVPTGTYKVQFSSLGYAPIEQTIELTENMKLDIALVAQGEALEPQVGALVAQVSELWSLILELWWLRLEL